MSQLIQMLLHKSIDYEDQIVYLTGNVYQNCVFRRCVLIMKGFPTLLEGCTIDNCAWHIDAVFHDANQVQSLADVILPAMMGSVGGNSPQIAAARQRAASKKTKPGKKKKK